MGSPNRRVQVESHTLQIAPFRRRNVIQAIEPEAEDLLYSAGGTILHHAEDYIYEEDLQWNFPTIVLYWPAQTRFVYVEARGQEDSNVIFMAAHLPDGQGELHVTYDYRPVCPRGPWDVFLTLRVADVALFDQLAGEGG